MENLEKNFPEQLQDDTLLIENYLQHCFDRCAPHADLYDAMRYSLLAGGKRLRPILTLETCRMCGGAPEAALPFACAVELIHTYSLIHDDLPCMDDDDLRRGHPTNHKVFGEAMAVLAGDALLTAAFELAAGHGTALDAGRTLQICSCLGQAAGGQGMVGGQALDMAGEDRPLTVSDVENLQVLKTGALISAAAEIGCIVAGGSEEDRAAVRRYAQNLGLAFQIRDDILDVAGDEAVLGKSVGSDARSGKTTFVTLLGLDACEELVEERTKKAEAALRTRFDTCEFLCWLTEKLVLRES